MYILQHVTGLSFSRLITSAKSPVQEASENIFGRDESKNQKGKVIDAYFQSDLKDQVVSHLIKIKWAKRIIREGARIISSCKANRLLKVFFRCICHCHCHCLCLCLCLFVGHVMAAHHLDQMSQRSQVSRVTL